ncbi:MAG TPA: hypothetical protein VH392_04815 [Sphingomicrobium sp.]
MALNSLAAWLIAPPFAGAFAPILGLGAVAVPTAILSLDHALPAGACCTTYFPFVMMSAVLIGPVYASFVGVGSAFLADALFMGPRYQLFEAPMDGFGDIASLVSSALIIALVYAFRKLFAQLKAPQFNGSSKSGIVFSLEKGVAWASVAGSDAPVRLGSQDEVAAMMEDFLAQLEVGKRLNERLR